MTFLSCLSSNIVNIALPTISKKMSAPLSQVQLIVTGYIITICILMLVFGRLGDIKGKIKVFKFGILIFTIGSLICFLSTNFNLIVFGRIIQGIGASAYMANNQGIITETFPFENRGKALGSLASAVALGTMLGSPLGGLIVSYLPWHWIFFINVPLGIICFALTCWKLPSENIKSEIKLDYFGSLLAMVLMLMIFTFFELAPKYDFSIALWLGFGIACFLLGILFVKFEKYTIDPLFNFNILKNRSFTTNIICALLSFLCLSASIISLPFFFQNVLKMSAATTGYIMMIQSIIMFFLAPMAGRLVDHFRGTTIALIGSIILLIGFIILSITSHSVSLVGIILGIVVLALGQAFYQPANNTLIMSAIEVEYLGVAGSLNSLVRNLGQVIGILLATSILAQARALFYSIGVLYLMLAFLTFITFIFYLYEFIRNKKQI